jgi:hypothetical protein
MDKPKEKKKEQVPQQRHAFQDDVQISKQVESTPLKLLKDDGIILDPHLSWEDAHKQIAGTKDFEVAHNAWALFDRDDSSQTPCPRSHTRE